MKLFYTLVTFGVAFQLAAFIFYFFQVVPYVDYPLGNIDELTNFFSIDVFDIMFTGSGLVVIGLAGLLLRQGTYAIYAMLIWAIGTILPIIRNFFLVIPNTIGGLMNLVTVGYSGAADYVTALVLVFSAIFAYAAFWWLFSMVTQRSDLS